MPEARPQPPLTWAAAAASARTYQAARATLYQTSSPLQLLAIWLYCQRPINTEQ